MKTQTFAYFTAKKRRLFEQVSGIPLKTAPRRDGATSLIFEFRCLIAIQSLLFAA
jgi:hypothetical protein